METAFILGLTSGGSCLASCGPLAAALLASEEITLRRSSALLSAFLSGRLLGYLCWAVLSWLLGWLISQSTKGFALFCAADLVLGAWLICFGMIALDQMPILGDIINPHGQSRSLDKDESARPGFFLRDLSGLEEG